jgi:hypothetical protein
VNVEAEIEEAAPRSEVLAQPDRLDRGPALPGRLERRVLDDD